MRSGPKRAGRLVFDTSTLVAALIYPDRVPAQAFRLALREFEICASADTLVELGEVLRRDRFERWRPLPERAEFAARYFALVTRIADVAPVAACRDPKDDKFLALALAANARCIVSSDDDLLVLHPWRSIPVLRAADFLARFGKP